MVHRTDITGRSVGRQVLAMTTYGPALNSALLENNFSLSRQKCCRLLTTAVPPLHAIYLELLTL